MTRWSRLVLVLLSGCWGPPFYSDGPDSISSGEAASDAAREDATDAPTEIEPPHDAAAADAMDASSHPTHDAGVDQDASDACAPATRMIDAALAQCAKLGPVPAPGFYLELENASSCQWVDTPRSCLCAYTCACILKEACAGAACDDTSGVPTITCR